MLYSRDAQELLRQSAEKARQLGHCYVGSIHILMSLLGCRGLPGYLLASCGVKEQMLTDLATVLYGTGTPGLPLHQGFSRQASSILRLAAIEARHGKKQTVEPVHIFLAMLRQENAASAGMLRICGVEPRDLFDKAAGQMQREMAADNLKKEATNMRLLEQFSEDLIQKVYNLDPVIGRDREIETVIGILSRKNKNNPALIG